MKKLFVLGLLVFVLPTAHAASAPACGDKEKQTPVYKAISACQELKAAKDAVALSENSPALKLIHDGCMVMNYELFPAKARDDEKVSSVCADPAGFLCGQSAKYILSSDCHLVVEADSDLADVPSVVDDQCAIAAKQRAFLRDHSSECKRKNGSSCTARLKVKYRNELRQLEWDQAYTPERVSRMKRLFELVRAREVRLIQESTMIPADRKEKLAKLVGDTTLSLPPFDGDPPDCANAGPKGPEGGIYNDESEHVVVCIGMMESLDYYSDAGLVSTLGHEIGHSIDPCALEEDAHGNHHPDTAVALKTYPGLLTCLRGGQGEDGCQNGILHCTDHKGMHQYCDSQSPVNSSRWKECHALVHDTPSCNDYSAYDRNVEDSNDLSLYRTKGEASDQIEESFADYIGVEALGALLQEGQLPDASAQGHRLDALSGAISDLKQLHGGCLKENTKDAHPPAFLRLNRVMMSSKRFREGLGCSGAPPQTAEAGITCPAF
jgi:hypothetical protein